MRTYAVCMNQTCAEPHTALAPCHPPQRGCGRGSTNLCRELHFQRATKIWLKGSCEVVLRWCQAKGVSLGSTALWSLPGTTIIVPSAWPTFPSTACEIYQHLCLNMIINKRLLSWVLSFFSPLFQHTQLLSTLAYFCLSFSRCAIKAATLYFLLQAAVGIRRAPVSSCEPSLMICDPQVQSRDLNLDLPITLKIRQSML